MFVCVSVCAYVFVFTMELHCDAVFGGCESDVLGLVTDNSIMMSTSTASVM